MSPALRHGCGSQPQVILFDLGNVLLRLKTGDFLRRLRAGNPGLDADQFMAELQGPGGAHDAYERGQLTGREFHGILASRWGLAWDYDAWLSQWRDYFTSNPPMEVLVAKLVQMGKPRLFVLSNTNAEHLSHIAQVYRFLDAFEGIFASHELGLRKPEPEIFDAVIKKTGVPAQDILYIDDMAGHVEAARTAGMRAFRYSFNDLELKAYLKENGLDLPVWESRPRATGC